jgi:hypothetical protein
MRATEWRHKKSIKNMSAPTSNLYPGRATCPTYKQVEQTQFGLKPGNIYLCFFYGINACLPQAWP